MTMDNYCDPNWYDFEQNDQNEVCDDEYIRCPRCREIFNYCQFEPAYPYNLLGDTDFDGELEIDCLACGHAIKVCQSITILFTSPPLIERNI